MREAFFAELLVLLAGRLLVGGLFRKKRRRYRTASPEKPEPILSATWGQGGILTADFWGARSSMMVRSSRDRSSIVQVGMVNS